MRRVVGVVDAAAARLAAFLAAGAGLRAGDALRLLPADREVVRRFGFVVLEPAMWGERIATHRPNVKLGNVKHCVK